MKKAGTFAVRRTLLAGLFLALLAGWGEARAATMTFVREYTYQAGEADSKLSSRAIALEQVKRLLLEELGTYLVSHTEVKDAALTRDEIMTYTAGQVATEIMTERWDGESYYLKAKISADPDEVARSVAALREDHEKADELAQLRNQTSESLKEIERLRRELAKARASAGPEDSAKVAAVRKEYDSAVAQVAAKEYVDQGLVLQNSGQSARAADAFGKAIEAAPSWARPYVMRGSVYNQLQRPRQSLADLDAALRLAPKDQTALMTYGIALVKAGRRAEGMAQMERAVSLAGAREYRACIRAGDGLLRNGMPREAVAFLSRSIQLRPNGNARAYFLRAVAFKRLGQRRKALADLRIAEQQQGQPQPRRLLR